MHYTQDSLLSSNVDWTTIIETVGTDDNYCIKYSDGRMIAIQAFTLTGSVGSGDTWGQVYSKDIPATSVPDFAATFISAPIVERTLNSSQGFWVASFGLPSTTKSGAFTIARPTTIVSYTIHVHVVAYGRWKA